jgi:Flp pilus assembly pilin Flp
MLMFKSSRNKQEKGLGLVIYAMILALVAVVVIAVLTLLGTINGSLSDVGGGGGVAAPSLTWGTDNFYNEAEVCNASGVPSGGTVYLWTENASMQNGDAFYWTRSSTAPVSGYHLMSTTVCP